MMELVKERREPAVFDGRQCLVEVFKQRYQVVEAGDSQLLEAAYRLRYQVYCRERGFEDPAAFPEGCERDEYDGRSVHSLILDRWTGLHVGTVRMILPLEIAPHRSFPIQQLTSSTSTTGVKAHHTLRAAEISRFAVSKDLRRSKDRPAERYAGADQYCVTLGLIRALVQMSLSHGITEWYAVMEPSLLRLLARFGVYFRPIGPVVDYHGMRQPCHANLYSLLERVYREREDIWDVLTDEGRLLVGVDRECLRAK